MVTRKPISVLLISVIQCYITVPIAQTCQVSLQQTAEAFSQRTDMACTSTLGINLIISRRQKYKISSRCFWSYTCLSAVQGCPAAACLSQLGLAERETHVEFNYSPFLQMEGTGSIAVQK